MSDLPTQRRSQRDRRPPKQFSTSSTSGKRKRNDHSDAEDDPDALSAPEDVASDGDEAPQPEEDEDVEDYNAVKSNPPPAKKGKSKATPTKQKAPAASKKPRTAKAAVPKPVKSTTIRKPKKSKVNDASFNPEEVAKETKILADNPLFNAIMNPAAALQATAEDFLESLAQDAGSAQAELINLILRACGCNESVNADEAADHDGILDTLDNFTEDLKKDESPTYPLTSKLAPFKKFRTHLAEFMSRLIISAADLGSLYKTEIISILQAWVICMSSSPLRSFRHTATVLALDLEAALCDVARSVEKEVEVVGRQQEGEKKRKARGGAANAKAKSSVEKELEGKMKEINVRKTALLGYIKEIVDGVFVHRYRDLDPAIRTECIESLGLFFKKYPSHFLADSSHLRYVGWLLSDVATSVRLAAVKALQTVYSMSAGDSNHLLTYLNHFTERFKPRLLEMAEGDTEISVRVAVLRVLRDIDGAGLLEENERERLGALVFCEDPKVRKGVAEFVRGVWEEWTEERITELGTTASGTGKKGKSKTKTDEDKVRVGIKGLVVLLVKWGKTLDEIIGDDEDEMNDTPDELDGPSGSNSRHAAALATSTSQKPGSEGRTALAIEALWDELEPAHNWEAILQTLLLDHSSSDDQGHASRSRGRGRKGKQATTADDGDEDEDDAYSIQVDDAWRLDEVEEGILLEILIASLKRTSKDALANKKGEEEDNITRALIKAVPRLLLKHQTDENRLADVLVLPTLMNLDLYMEMRMVNKYAKLWDDVIKQFTTHSSPLVLNVAAIAINQFMETTALSNTNSTKIIELEDELSTSLRDSVAGKEEIEIASFTDDEVLSLTALILRLKTLAGRRNMISWIEENEGGKQSSAWDILNAIAERGRLGYREEEMLIQQTLQFLMLHVIWKCQGLTSTSLPSPDETQYQESLTIQRESLLEKLVEFAVGTQCNTVDGVKRTAFKVLLDLHVLFASSEKLTAEGAPSPLAAVALNMDDETQYRCAGYIQAEIERYADTLDLDTEGPSDDAASDAAEGAKKAKTKHVAKRSKEEIDMTTQPRLIQEYMFIDVMSTFLRAIRAGAIHVRHGAILLAHHGRLGASFDMCAKVVIEVLREEGVMNDQADLVELVAIQAIQEAFTLVMDGTVQDESNAQQLAKLLASSFIIRGSHLAIIRRLDTKHILQIQMTLLTWVGKHLTTAQKNGNKKSMKKAISFFKVLTPLSAGIPNRDALTIKAHAEHVLAQAKVDVTVAPKQWEPLRAYEKRLGIAPSREKGPGRTGKAKKAAANAVTDDEDDDSEAEQIMDDALRPETPASDADEAEAATPQARPRPRPKRVYKGNSMSPTKTAPRPFEEDDMDVNGSHATPKKTQKRRRDDDDDEAPHAPDVDADQEETEPAAPPLQIRRKRARH